MLVTKAVAYNPKRWSAGIEETMPAAGHLHALHSQIWTYSLGIDSSEAELRAAVGAWIKTDRRLAMSLTPEGRVLCLHRDPEGLVTQDQEALFPKDYPFFWKISFELTAERVSKLTLRLRGTMGADAELVHALLDRLKPASPRPWPRLKASGSIAAPLSLLKGLPQAQSHGTRAFSKEDAESWLNLRKVYPATHPLLLAGALVLQTLRAMSSQKAAGILLESFDKSALGPHYSFLSSKAPEQAGFEDIVASASLQSSSYPPDKHWAVLALDSAFESLPADDDFALRFSLTPDGMPKLLHDQACPEASRIHRLFQHALKSAAAKRAPDFSREISDLVHDFNQTTRSYPHHPSLPDLLKESFASHASKTALEWDRGSMTFRDLDRASDALARHLKAQGLGQGDLIGLGLPRDESMLVSLLAVLKCGAGYVPLDPSFPAERIRYMAEHSKLKACLCDEVVYELTHDISPCIRLEELRAIYAETSAASFPLVRIDPEQIAYVIYTSGSTGLPKGVMLSHRSVINFLQSMREAPGMNPGDKILAVTTLSFDIAVLEIFLPLLSGASLYLATSEQAKDGRQLGHLLSEQRISHFQATASTYRLLLDAGWNGKLKQALCGGEAFPLDVARRLKAHAQFIWNMYGPTETTVWSSIYCLDGSEDMIPIGRPIANTFIVILDEQLNPVFPGIKGEIYIGGSGLALGYLGRPDLTEERFLYLKSLDQKLYKTGDIGSFRWDGTLEIFGRSDGQIKLRGYRMELGEIEAVMSQGENIGIALATVRDFGPEDQRLIAYLQVKGEWVEREFRQALRAKLPSYMIPQHFVLLEHFPLLPNGKIDRKALPHPQGIEESSPADGPSAANIALTTSQARMLYVDELDPHTHVHNLIGAWQLSRPFDDIAFRQALYAMIQEQEALRMSITISGGSAAIQLNDSFLPEIERWMLPSQAAAKAFIEEESKKPLDLQKVPNFRIGFIDLPNREGILYLFTHHIFWDGFSYGVFWKLLQKHYREALALGLAEAQPSAYRYSHSTRDRARAIADRPELARYWKDLHSPLPENLNLSYDHPRPKELTHAADSVRLIWDSALDSSVLAFARAQGVTPYHVLLSVYVILLQRLSQQDEIVIGTPVLGRQKVEEFDLLGNFINALALRIKIRAGSSFIELLQKVKTLVREAMDHAEYPIETLVAELKIPRDPSRTPLYDCMFFFQDHSNDKIQLGDQVLKPFLADSQTVDTDLVLWIERYETTCMAGFNFRKDLWKTATVAAIADSYKKLLRDFMDRPSARIDEPAITQDLQRKASRPPLERRKTADASMPSPRADKAAGNGAKVVCSEDEAKIVRIFQAVLGPQTIRPDDNFFDAGGHSLLALKVLHLLEEELGLKLKIRDLLFRNVSQLAHDLDPKKGTS